VSVAAQPAALRSDRVALRPLDDSDVAALYALCCREPIATTWRYRGLVPHPEQFSSDLFDGLLIHYLAEPTSQDAGDQFGYVAATRYSPIDGHCHISALFSPAMQGTLASAHALRLFCGTLFAAWPLRKLLIEVPEFNMGHFRSGLDRRPMVHEGVLQQHLYVGGRHHDVHLLAVWRDDWYRWANGRAATTAGTAHNWSAD
jgi:RimJ/RimL family protein N-acetyltransferase